MGDVPQIGPYVLPDAAVPEGWDPQKPRRYTAAEAAALYARYQCWERGHHMVGGIRGASWGGPPSPFEMRWDNVDKERCGCCDALVSVEYPGPLGIEVEA